ncbi:hypothetical protein BD779DRAFT_1493877 [Infundibulicybe gibba]|nr:hypothetical protein BD779DRAFT_1493877 [Infundibulicybe gibba]
MIGVVGPAGRYDHGNANFAAWPSPYNKVGTLVHFEISGREHEPSLNPAGRYAEQSADSYHY